MSQSSSSFFWNFHSDINNLTALAKLSAPVADFMWQKEIVCNFCNSLLQAGLCSSVYSGRAVMWKIAGSSPTAGSKFFGNVGEIYSKMVG